VISVRVEDGSQQSATLIHAHSRPALMRPLMPTMDQYLRAHSRLKTNINNKISTHNPNISIKATNTKISVINNKISRNNLKITRLP
jgi:hypothetical protein